MAVVYRSIPLRLAQQIASHIGSKNLTREKIGDVSGAVIETCLLDNKEQLHR